MSWLIALLSIAFGHPMADGPEAPPQRRVVEGPWTRGDYAAVASQGGTVYAVWLTKARLLWSSSQDRGQTWSEPATVAEKVDAGDGGQIRPDLAVTETGVVAAFSSGNQPHLARYGADGWTVQKLRDDHSGVGALLDLAVVEGKPLVVWLDTRRGADKHLSDVYAWFGGEEERVYADGADGVCVCCAPAAGEIGGLPAVAFRDADGPLREIRVLTRGKGARWVDHGPATHGGWAPGGCPADGPDISPRGVVVSDARDGHRRIYVNDDRVQGAGSSQALQPRSVGDHLVWVHARPGKLSLKLDKHVVARSKGRMEPGDPVRIDGEIWIPWQGEHARIVAVSLD